MLKPIEKEPDGAFEGAAHLKTTIGTGAVVYLSSDLIPIDRKNWFGPAWVI